MGEYRPGNFRFDLEDTWDSVTFNSTPYLVFRERQEGQAAKDAMKTLLSTSIGYDMGGKNDEMQVLCETQKWLGKEILHVARFGSLIIGKEILLTWGEVSAPAIRKNNIIVNDTDSRPLVTVRITVSKGKGYLEGRPYYINVPHDTSLAAGSSTSREQEVI
ncbi:hypothetical protein LY78DRAFT_302432 [Colletotrichum sublineola]|nr:hypothetical protein LY78DRAFT_302432 [Colletotrichum sublineola]